MVEVVVRGGTVGDGIGGAPTSAPSAPRDRLRIGHACVRQADGLPRGDGGSTSAGELRSAVGHGTIRAAGIGFGCVTPDVNELTEMIRPLECALDDGAFGMPSGLVSTWRLQRDP